MSTYKKKIAVVGGGIGGIVAIAALKEAGVFEPICFEKTDRFGGTWYYREESLIGVASTMSTTVVNNSKEIGAFSNFPPRKEYNNFMKHHELHQALQEYVEAKDILRHMCFNSEVFEVKRSFDYDTTGRWIVTVVDTLTGAQTTDTYDGVLLCIGHVNTPIMPVYTNQSIFKGKIMHTHNLKEVSEFRNKTVLVIGMGCSGLDAAVESSNVTKQVYLSTRSGQHVMTRMGLGGYPFDYVLMKRWMFFWLELLPTNISSWILENVFVDQQFDHRLFPVKPNHHLLARDPVLNDNFGSKLLSGSIIQKGNIERFTETGVVFIGDSHVTDIDVVIMATGYTWNFPFLEEGIIVQEEGRINLYKLMYPPHLTHGTLAVIGFILPFGPGFPIEEIQCRWSAHILAGKGKLPSMEAMYDEIIRRHSKNVKRYSPAGKMTIRTDYISYMDEIATQFGVKPNFFKLFFTDIRLFWKLMFGPSLSYQYRLQGPFPWDGARDAIMTSDERMLYPLKKDNREDLKENIFIKFVKKILKFFISY